jgi:hypothetical protein
MSTSELIKTLPLSLIVAMFIIVYILGQNVILQYDLSNQYFLIGQMQLNFSLIVAISFLFGIVILSFPEESSIKQYSYILFFVFIMIVMWLKEYLIYYTALQNSCSKINDDKANIVEQVENNQNVNDKNEPILNHSVILFNTLKLIGSIFIVYSFVLYYSNATTKPFFELFGTQHPLIYYFAVGFWVGCATWPSEASIYYSLLRSGCKPNKRIQLQNLTGEDDDKQKNKYD